MTLAILINGQAPETLTRAIHVNDRGLHYGDGLFETTLLVDGRIRFLESHLQRLADGCKRLGLTTPDFDVLHDELDRVTRALRVGVVKIIVTRGISGRGYRPDPDASPTRIIAVYAAPSVETRGVHLRWCDTRLGRNAQLAGVKHLNRLEQVLAQAERSHRDFDEGMMLDTEGELVCATAANVFVVRDGALATPDLRFCGVRGVMRAQVMRAAKEIGLSMSEEPLWPHDLDHASEVFITNAVRGVRSVVSLGALTWTPGPVADRLARALHL